MTSTITERTESPAPAVAEAAGGQMRQGVSAGTAERGVIILGVEYQALGLLRQLHAAGVPFVLVDQDRWGAARLSKYRCPHYESPSYASDQFWPWLVNLAAREGYSKWVLIPTDDEQVRQIALHHEEAQSVFSVASLPWSRYRLLYNKRTNYEWCLECGIDTPRSYLPKHRDDLPEAELGYPFIIKPAFRRTYGKYCKAKAIRIESREQLQEVLGNLLQAVPIEDLIYQEIIPGGGEQQWSYAGLFEAGIPKAAFTARRRRQHPPDFGRASTYVEALHDPEVEAQSRRIMERLEYSGLAEVEWKRDPRTGELKFLEVNARCWGWHSLASQVVGNLPALLVKQLAGGELAPVAPRYGARWVKHITDVPVALHLMRRGELSLREYARSLRGAVMCCEWERGDPWPFFLQFFLLTYLMKRRGY